MFLCSILQDGVLRVGGRLSRAAMPEESKHPAILSKDFHVTELILREIHQDVGHNGHNHMLFKLRQNYWIPGANSAIGRVLVKCVVCRRLHSVSSDSFINALRHVIARRGQVSVLRSDNGTNFIGAERELRKAIKGWNCSKIENTLHQYGIQWKFNPPTGSHHGGVWERLIRSIRKILNECLSVELEELRSESLRIKLERTDEDMDKSDLHGELIMGVQRPIEPSTLPDSRAPIVEELASSLRQDAEPTATEARKELTEQHRRSQRVEEDLSRLNSIDLAQSGPAYCTQICRLPVSDQGTEQLNLVPENSSKRFNSPRRGSNKKHIKNKQNRLSTANLLKQDLGHLWSHIVDSHAEHQADQTEKESTDDSQIEPCSGSVDTNPEVNKNQKPNLQSKCNQGEDVVPDCIQQGWRLESGEQRHGQRLEKTSQREMVKTLRSYTVTVESSSLQARQTKQQQLQQKQQKTKKQQQQQQSLPSSTIPPAPGNEHAIDSDGKNQGHMLCPQQEEDSTATATAEVAAGKRHTPQRTPVRKRLHSCDQCGKGFREPERLDEHRPSCTGKKPYHCWQCGKSFLHPSKLKAHKHVHAGQRRHCCTHCGKNFTRASTLKTHQHIHTGARPYKCPQCGKTFNQSGALHSHLQTHSGDRPYTCKDCGKSFGKEINLKRHQLTHTGEKPHACDQCGKSFSQAGDLKTHQRIHTGEKPYSCKQCGKSFIQSSQLLKHQRIHTGEKLYKCPVCKKCFLQSGHLKSHQKSHTEERPFSCDECGKKYKNSRSLRFHKQVHTGERPHGCPQCGMNFFRSDTLKIHQRIHTGEKPYQCKRCGRRFNELGNLKRHRRCHTANKP
ncbi:ZN675 protein, partial [Amia calva]|nr:ZN675 protein [Amia calva]